MQNSILVMESLFTIGQKVVCVDSKGKNIHLVEGKTYTINGIKKVDCCGGIVVDVGIRVSYRSTNCGYCGGKYNHDGYRRQNRFVPLDFDRQADSEIFEALRGEKFISSKPDNQ